MKRLISIVLLLSVILPLTACKEQAQIREGVTFYYRNPNIASGSEVIIPEIREAEGIRDDIRLILREYLKGPKTDGFSHVIPSDTVLYSFSMENNEAEIVLSDEFARLSGLDLTIACACITKTVIGLCNVQTVKIRCLNTDLECGRFVVMDEDSLMLFGSPTAPTETEGV